MAEVESTVTELLVALSELRGSFAKQPKEIRNQLTPRPTEWDDVYGLDISHSTSDEVTISSYLECKIAGISNVWWMRIRRSGESGWAVERWVELYPLNGDGDEEVTIEFETVICPSSAALTTSLPSLAKELLAVAPPSTTVG